MHEAMYYRKEADSVRCLLCPHRCLLKDNSSGICGVRKAAGGRLYSINYGRLATAQRDPLEKKPLYHFFPGRSILSLGTFGCNLHCSFCQNWGLARGNPEREGRNVSSIDILTMLESDGGPEEALGVAYTYNEPLTWYEFVLQTAVLLREKGYRNVLITNGFIEREPLLELLPYIDALNIDLKGFSDNFYRQYCGGTRKTVMQTIEAAAELCHVEVTCLLIPSLNDSVSEQEDLARWLSGLSPDMVLHYSRYFPQFRMKLPPTPAESLDKARATALKHLRYVYLGNIDLAGSSDTRCPFCGNLLVERGGYHVRIHGLDGTKCANCHHSVSMIR